jgi:hypothetical protein
LEASITVPVVVSRVVGTLGLALRAMLVGFASVMAGPVL